MCSLLQVIFLGIKLDQVVQWKWGVSIHMYICRNSSRALSNGTLPPSLPPSSPLQIVFIPTYLLLLAYLCGVCVYCGYLLFLPFSSSLSPQQLQTRRLADILRAACLVAVGLCVTVFVVSDGSSDGQVLWFSISHGPGFSGSYYE